jgi:acyl carrier protein
LTQEKLSKHLTDPHIQKIYLDRDCSEIRNQPITNPQIKLAPENLAYIIYTSGSTGKPKGVQIPHIAVVNFLLSMSKEPGLTRNDALLAVTTLSFDISVLEIFLPLILGAKTVIASREDAVNGQRLLQLLEKSGATVMQATPTTWYLLLAAGWESSGEFKVLCGGEPMPQDLALKLVNRSGNVWNLYGPTETTIWSTIYQVTGGKSSILVGRPIANTQLYIVNQKDQLNPVGVAGELLIGGIGVSRGYLNRPNLTEEKFIPNHYSETSNERLYRTGDLACYLPDGNVKLFGRLDNQVKLRGFRIELGEIEAILERYSTVDKAVVLIREEETGSKRLVAYVSLQPNSDYSEFELRQYLKKNLPEYMVPSIFVLMEEMPLTPNKKIDRKSLPQPELKRPDVGEELILPQNEIEKNISRAWSEILKIDVIGTQDNFFDLGGDSLLCVQLVMHLEKELNTDIPVVKFFEHPTIKSFAEYINNKSNAQQVLLKKVESRTHLQRKALMQRQRFSKRLNEKS